MITLNSLVPDSSERAVFVGKTGCGKTTLARTILERYENVIVFDAKGLIEWPGYKRYTHLSRMKHCRAGKFIYAPNIKELDSEAHHAAFFKWIYERKNTICYVDEVFSVCHGLTLPFYYRACITRGRERGIGVFSSTQRPLEIPQIVLSESESWFIWHLKMPQDRKKVYAGAQLAPGILESLPDDHSFIFATNTAELGPLKLQL